MDPVSQLEHLESLRAFTDLTENQKAICKLAIENPELKYREIAVKVGTSPQSVYNFFRTSAWDVISADVCRREFNQLSVLAVRTFKDCLLRGNFRVRLEAASKILTNTGYLSPNPVIKKDREMLVFWKGNGHTDTIQPALETGGNPLLESEV